MSLRKRKGQELPEFAKDDPNSDMSSSNPAHYADENTNFVLRPIGYEQLDQAVWQHFDRKFTIRNKQLGVIQLDAEVASTIFENPESINDTTKYVNLPYFTVWRSKSAPTIYRVSPTHKPVVYAIPKQKPQGIVYEEWITTTPQWQTLSYTMKFMTRYRGSTNELEESMMRHFRNKRVIVEVEGERFELSPADTNTTVGELEIVDREGVENKMLYIVTFELSLFCYIRRVEDMQKRERPNIVEIQIKEQGGANLDIVTETVRRLPDKFEE